jgi:uncharacterized membrane protein
MFKNFLKSKTLWTNLFFIVVMLVQSKTGFVIDANLQFLAIVVVNLVLRQFTKSGLTLDLKPVSVDPADAKRPFASKVFWVNIIAMAALAIQHFTGQALSIDKQAELLGLINVVLRVFTKTPVSWGSDSDAGVGKIGYSG